MQNKFFDKSRGTTPESKTKKIELGLVFMDTDIVYKFQMIFLGSVVELMIKLII